MPRNPSSFIAILKPRSVVIMDALEALYETDSSFSPDEDAIVIGRSDISEYNPGNILPESVGVLSDITTWLRPTDYDSEGSEYQKHRSFHLLGTGDWVFSTSAYRRWHDGPDPGILWIRGTSWRGCFGLTRMY